jgi:hypothetical protein
MGYECNEIEQPKWESRQESMASVFVSNEKLSDTVNEFRDDGVLVPLYPAVQLGKCDGLEFFDRMERHIGYHSWRRVSETK